MNLEINESFKKAIELIENTNKNIFITGRAGTGKSTLLEYFRSITRKKIVILAPTGVAALNVKGQTIHSFFRFKPDITLSKVEKVFDERENLYKEIETIIIDEISMVRADILDCIDKFLRINRDNFKRAFGGVQMVFIGDLYQLPPVVTKKEKILFESIYETPYFYSAKVFKNFDMEFIELEKVYRQEDSNFIEILNSIRSGKVTEEEIEKINSRYIPDFEPKDEEFYIFLVTTNKDAEKINNSRLEMIKSPLFTFKGLIEGEFSKDYLPTNIFLNLKKDAQIMLVNNDFQKRWINGTLGKIVEIFPEENIILVKSFDGREFEVEPHTWENFEYYIEKDELKTRTIGKFTQFPIILAWAVTIHKSQGKTFEKVIIDVGKGTFAPGQIYVALSRCRTLEGIILKRPIKKYHIWSDWKIVDFLTKYQYKKSEEKLPFKKKIEIIKKAIDKERELEIVYLKPNDEKTKRVIIPLSIEEMEYCEEKFIGLKAFCKKRNAIRNFRIDRIIEISFVEEK
ncbi:MAG: AAA family ATPase [bacterium]|nr:AAA family ATPase [bacterium]MDW8163275.1 AAA family ATPase [Candidatus Omnitrophota bacterium]